MSITDQIAITRRLVGLDCETTGTDPRSDRIVEVAFIEYRPDGTEREWSTYVNPGIPIPREASAIHHITDADVLGKPTFAQIAASLAKGFTDCDFFGTNIKFDLDMLAEEFKRCGVAWSYDAARIVDSHRIWQLGAPRTLSDAAKVFLGREHVGAHGALEDIRMSRDIIAAQLAKWPTLPRDLPALHEAQFPKNPHAIDGGARFVWNAQGEATIGFGKHRGTPLSRIDKGYLKWIVGQEFTEEVKTIARNALNGVYPTKEAM